MSITPLGSGQEVGRSCHILEFRGMTIMLDCGIHPGYDGMNGLPFLDRVEPEQIDVLLITHFHLDHAASLPYLTERTPFKGRIFMVRLVRVIDVSDWRWYFSRGNPSFTPFGSRTH